MFTKKKIATAGAIFAVGALLVVGVLDVGHWRSFGAYLGEGYFFLLFNSDLQVDQIYSLNKTNNPLQIQVDIKKECDYDVIVGAAIQKSRLHEDLTTMKFSLWKESGSEEPQPIKEIAIDDTYLMRGLGSEFANTIFSTGNLSPGRYKVELLPVYLAEDPRIRLQFHMKNDLRCLLGMR